MIIPQAPEDYKETTLYKLLLSKDKPDDDLIGKVTCFINAARPLQELIIAGPFKDYTLHNPNHSKKLIHLAEFIIPKETLNKLSALELAVLILAFYLHDLGMVLTQTERDRIIKSESFIEFIQIKTLYFEKIERIRGLLADSAEEDKLSIETTLFQLVEAALADYLRPIHATKLRYQELLIQIKESTGRNDLFDVSGVSFENELIEVCISHNLNSSALLETSGIHKDRYPRNQAISNLVLNSQYCSAILRLVDILDFDKERTPKSLFNSLGIQNKRMPGFEISLKEWNKHLAIHTISINSYEIVVSGDSTHPSIEHTIKEFCRIIESEIRETQTIISQNTAEILENYKLELPFLVRPDIRSIGYVYKDFSIRLNEAAITNLLMGENLYVNSQVALREVIQNSIDACNLRSKVDVDKYEPSILVSIEIDGDSRSWLKIADNGIGMDEYVLSNYFFKIGNSYYSSKDFQNYSSSRSVNDFIPISRFGIGLLSVFMIGELLKVTTKNGFSQRNDFKERTMLIDGTDSLAVVTELEEGTSGTTVEILLKKVIDTESYSSKLLGFVKENIIRPSVPVLIDDYNGNKLLIGPDKYIRINNGVVEELGNLNIETVQIDLSRFSNILKGRIIFFLFINEDGSLSYYDKRGDMKWGDHPLKKSYLFNNFLGGSRITVNGMLMRFKKIGSLFNVGSNISSVVLDVEVCGIREIEYDVSRDRVFGKGLHIIRKEIFRSVGIGFDELGISNRLDKETIAHFEIAKDRYTQTEPLDKEVIQKVIDLLPSGEKWNAEINEYVAETLGLTIQVAKKYILAVLKMGLVKKL